MSLKPVTPISEKPLKIKRALLSVSDKNGISELAEKLYRHGVEIISTGGTADVLKKNGIPVTDVSELTGFPECLGGRLKTLHPGIHGGILARTSYENDINELNSLNIKPIELVIVNLYPFKKTIEKADVTPEEAIENIDIGGPTMVRAAAKNFAHVCILTSPHQYQNFITEFDPDKSVSFETRRTLARQAFEHTADYDTLIASYFSQYEGLELPNHLLLSTPKSGELRYGENPHQLASVYGAQSEFIDCFHGKELSYNNYLDIDSALELMADFKDDAPTVAIFKHTVPCGVAAANTLSDAYKRAFATDKVSPFGGIVIVNKPLDLPTAKSVDSIFTEIILAPGYEEDVIEFLQEKKNRRLVRIKKYPDGKSEYRIRSIFGGALYQQADHAMIAPENLEIVTKREPNEDELYDMMFAWKVVKHVKSNAIVYAKNRATCGIGTGQTSRVESSVIAVRKAMNSDLSLKGSVVASDAFFPFPDGVIAAAQSGATAIIQPGGSVRDSDVIDAANEHNMAMVFTNIRHFKH